MQNIELIKNIIDYGILGLLGILSIVVVAFWIERILFYRGLSLEDYAHIKELEIAALKRLPAIATIGSSAPYIGLLGTVLAIILTFYIIGQKGGSLEAGEIMTSLALALKATAAGLLVAIPATVIYNLLLSRVDTLLAQWEILQDKGILGK